MAALWLTWRIVSASVRVLFARDGGISPAQKLLVLLPAALVVQGMLEHYLFVDSYSILNFLVFPVFGLCGAAGPAGELETGVSHAGAPEKGVDRRSARPARWALKEKTLHRES